MDLEHAGGVGGGGEVSERVGAGQRLDLVVGQAIDRLADKDR